MLQRAEELFGKRDHDFTILGVEFSASVSQVFFSGGYDEKFLIIRLNLECQKDMYQVCYQLAHETVHLLAPAKDVDINNFEEGIATYFAEIYMKEAFNRNWSPRLASYKRVLELVRPHLESDIEFVRRLRAKQPVFSKMTRRQLTSQCRNLSRRDADILLTKFDRNVE